MLMGGVQEEYANRSRRGRPGSSLMRPRAIKEIHGFGPLVFRSGPSPDIFNASRPSNSAVKGFVELLIAETPTFKRSLSLAASGENEVQCRPSGPKDA